MYTSTLKKLGTMALSCCIAGMIAHVITPVESASAAASFVRSSTNKATGSAGSHTLSVTLTGTPTAGNLLIAAISLKNQPSTTPSMSGWNTRTTACASGNVACTYVFTKLAAGNESTVSLSIDSTGVTYSAIITVLEYSGATNTFVTATTQTGTSSDTVETGTVSPARTGSMIFAIVTQNNGTAYTEPGTSPDPVTGWAKRTDEKNTASNALNIGYFDRLTSNNAGTSYSLSPTISGTPASWSSIIFNFDSAESAISDMSVANTVSNASPATGQSITFTLTATNNGSSDNTGVQITNTLPAGLTFVSASAASGTSFDSGTGVWNIGSLANGASKTLTITASVNSDQSGNTLTNSASITAADVTDSASGNNTATRSVNVLVTPTISSLSPEDGGSDVTITDNFVITFNTTMIAGEGSIHVWCGGSLVEEFTSSSDAVSISSSTVTINPTSNLPANSACYILIDSGAFQTSANNPFGGIASTSTWNFESGTDSIYLIASVPENVSVRTLTNQNPQSQGQNGNKWIRFRKTVGATPVATSDVNVSFAQNRNCNTSLFDTNVTDTASLPATPKSVIHLQSACGEVSGATHTLYILQGSATQARVCPEALTLDDVNESCTNGVVLSNGGTTTINSHTVTADFNVNIDGLTYIRISGLTGSGGQGEGSGDPGSVPDIGVWGMFFLCVGCGWILHKNNLLSIA